MDLSQVSKKRSALVQALLLVIMAFLLAVTYLSISTAQGPLVPALTILSLGACLYITITERQLRALQDKLVEELSAKDRAISAKDRTIRDLDQELADLQANAHADRLEAVATVIAGQAHEIATPISAARTAGQMAGHAAASLAKLVGDSEETAELFEELKDGCELLERNISRAVTLITAFRNQAARQLSDEVMLVDLKEVLSDCIYAMRPETKKHRVVAELHAPDGQSFHWNGYPGKFTQVVVNLFQNALRHAYADGSGGPIDIRLSRDAERSVYRVEFEDHGAGITPEVLPRIFDPMVTTARERGGTGLGLSISKDIVTKQLKGSLSCTSELGKGTTMLIEVPKDVLDDDHPAD